LQRFRCCACGRTFNDLTGTPLARLRHKGKWLDYLETVLDSRTVRSAAKRVGVHPNTTFRWRHRFLDRAKDDRPERLVGIVEADEMFLLESQKGSRKLDRQPRKRGGKAPLRGISHHLDCILVARDRSGQTIDAVTGRCALKVAQLVKHLLPKLAPQALLVTDANAAYPAFARAHAIAHQAVNLSAGERVRNGAKGAIHVQNVDGYHRRFKESAPRRPSDMFDELGWNAAGKRMIGNGLHHDTSRGNHAAITHIVADDTITANPDIRTDLDDTTSLSRRVPDQTVRIVKSMLLHSG